MNYAQINDLLEKYWDGETTLDEERVLKIYFSGETVDARLEKFQPLFLVFKAESALQFPGQAKTVKMSGWPTGQIYRWAAAASVVGLLAVGTWWYVRHQSDNQQVAQNTKLYEDTFDDPEKAAAEIKAALALVSSKMRKGKKEAAKGLRKMEAVDRYILKPKSNN